MRLLPAALLPSLLVAAAAAAQTAPPAAPPSAVTTGFMHALHATERVDATLAFYTDVFGVTTDIRPFENPGVALLTDAPGVKLRMAMLPLVQRVLNLELTEFTNVQRTPGVASIVDPGAAHMKILVRDLTPVLQALDARAAPIVTRSHAPVEVKTPAGTARAIFCRDPDGYLVEAIEVKNAEPGAGNVVGAIMGLTVEDLDETLRFWRDRLGFTFEKPSEVTSDAAMLDLFGIKGNVSFRTANGVVPGSTARLQLIEFRGVPRDKFDLRPTDPGAPGMAIRVAKIDELVPKLKSAGVRVISKDQQLVEWSPTVRNAFVEDPNGFNIEIVGEVQPPR